MFPNDGLQLGNGNSTQYDDLVMGELDTSVTQITKKPPVSNFAI